MWSSYVSAVGYQGEYEAWREQLCAGEDIQGAKAV